MVAAESVRTAAHGSGLGKRLVVGGLLAVVAILDIGAGGLVFSLMIAAGIMLVFWEWGAMHQTPVSYVLAGMAMLLAIAFFAHMGEPVVALFVLSGSMVLLLLVAFAARLPGRHWPPLGLAYAGLPGIALIWMRGEPNGLWLVLWTMGIVWATDILAYFVGRSIGGPKLWPQVSPNKTWSGLAGGMLAAALFSAIFAAWRGWPEAPLPMALAGLALAALAQAGDLLESWMKRRAGVKDSGKLLPGHGGLMDRVDGLVPVACMVALWIGLQIPARLAGIATVALP